jgi:hypothetical protein
MAGAGSGGGGAPAAPTSAILKLHEHAPQLEDDADPTQVVLHRLALRQAAAELEITDYVHGTLPTGASPDNVTLGKRWLLSGYPNKNIRGMIAVHGGNDGPSCWAWIQANMLGGRDEQEILNDMVDEMQFTGTTSVVDFFSRFLTISEAIRPALPAARLCTMYASRFPPGEYMTLTLAIDATVGHTNFVTYATAVNNAVQRYQQRLQLHDRRSGTMGNSLFVDASDEASRGTTREYDAYFTDSMPTTDATSWDDSYFDMGTLSSEIAKVVEAHYSRPSGGGRQARSRPTSGGRGSGKGKPTSYTSRSTSSRPSPTDSKLVCTNCGMLGHKSRDCKEKDAACTNPICKARGLTRHLPKYCWFYHEDQCPVHLRSRIQKIKAEHSRSGPVAAHLCEDTEEYPEDFADLCYAEPGTGTSSIGAHVITVADRDHHHHHDQCAVCDDDYIPRLGKHQGPSMMEHLANSECIRVYQFALRVGTKLHSIGLEPTVAYLRFSIMAMIVNYLSACMLVPPQMHEVALALQNADKPFRDFVLELADHMFTNMTSNHYDGQYFHLRMKTMAECIMHAVRVARPYAEKLTAMDNANKKKADCWWNDESQLSEVHRRLYGEREPPEDHFRNKRKRGDDEGRPQRVIILDDDSVDDDPPYTPYVPYDPPYVPYDDGLGEHDTSSYDPTQPWWMDPSNAGVFGNGIESPLPVFGDDANGDEQDVVIDDEHHEETSTIVRNYDYGRDRAQHALLAHVTRPRPTTFDDLCQDVLERIATFLPLNVPCESINVIDNAVLARDALIGVCKMSRIARAYVVANEQMIGLEIDVDLENIELPLDPNYPLILNSSANAALAIADARRLVSQGSTIVVSYSGFEGRVCSGGPSSSSSANQAMTSQGPTTTTNPAPQAQLPNMEGQAYGNDDNQNDNGEMPNHPYGTPPSENTEYQLHRVSDDCIHSWFVHHRQEADRRARLHGYHDWTLGDQQGEDDLRHLRESGGTSVCLVACVDPHYPIGLITAVVVPSRRTHVVTITQLYVHFQHRYHGIGRMLLQMALSVGYYDVTSNNNQRCTLWTLGRGLRNQDCTASFFYPYGFQINGLAPSHVTGMIDISPWVYEREVLRMSEILDLLVIDLDFPDSQPIEIRPPSPQVEVHPFHITVPDKQVVHAYDMATRRAISKPRAHLSDADGQLIDTGAAGHLEGSSGAPGFSNKRESSKLISTGLTVDTPVDYVGTHTQYVLGRPPERLVTKMIRHDVMMLSTFRKPLFSCATAFQHDKIESYFNHDPHLKLPNGTEIPFEKVGHAYILPRWFSHEAASEARRRLLASEMVNVNYSEVLTYTGQDVPFIAEVGGDVLPIAETLIKQMGNIGYFSSTSICACMSEVSSNFKTASKILKWHARTGHASPRVLLHLPAHMRNASELEGITRDQVLMVAGFDRCTVCPKARMHAKSHPRKDLRIEGHTTLTYEKFGDCIGVDNAVSFTRSFAYGYKHLTAFIDFATNFGAVYFQKTKGYVDSIPIRKRFIADHQKYGTIKHFHSDGAHELQGEAMLSWLTDLGITYSWTVPGESDMNNRTEGFIGRLSDKARALLIHSGIPEQHWVLAYLYACYLLNILPSYVKKLESVSSPYTRVTGDIPDASPIKVWGCVAHGYISREERRHNKLSETSRSGIFMGYPREQPGGAVYIWIPNQSKEAYVTVYSVVFDESRTYKDAWRRGREVSTAYGPEYEDEDVPTEATKTPTTPSPLEPVTSTRFSLGTPPMPIELGGDETPSTPAPSRGQASEGSNELATPPTDQGSRSFPQFLKKAIFKSKHFQACNSTNPYGGEPCNLKLGHIGQCSWDKSDKAVGRSSRSMGAYCLEYAGALGGGTSKHLHEHVSKFNDELIAGSTPCGMNCTDFGNTVDQALNEATPDEDTSHALLHNLVYTSWHAHYLAPKHASMRRIKPRKGKAKLCLIDDAMRHIDVPRNIKEVLLHEFVDNFLDACDLELDQQEDNQTWKLVPRTDDMNIVGSTWAFDIKRDLNKKILRFKARLCAQGFSQVKGVDYYRKYSHTVPFDVLRIFIAKCAMEGLEATEADYTTAYLNAHLDTKVYMVQPPGFHAVDDHGQPLRGPNGEEMVCRLDKAIYGLVQSGLMWEEEHHSRLKSFGWEQCEAEPCLFTRTFGDTKCYICTYVDNLFMGFPPKSMARETTLEELRQHYKISDLGVMSHTLNIRIQQNPRMHHATLDQEGYINDIVQKYKEHMVTPPPKARIVPMTEEINDIQQGDINDPETAKWTSECMQLGGKLNYISIGTRPDISAALSKCMRTASKATASTFQALMTIVTYLHHTKHYKLHYGNGLDADLKQMVLKYSTDINSDIWCDGDIIWFADASQGGEKPLQCNLGFIGGSIFSWKIGHFTWTTLSVCEGEYFAQSSAAMTIQSLEGVIKFLDLNVQFPIISFCDNEVVTKISSGDYTTKHMKHVLTRMAYLAEQVKNKLITIAHIGTDGNVADIGTKLLTPSIFHRFRVLLVY